MFSKFSLEFWVSPKHNRLKYYIQRLEHIPFKVINFRMSIYDLDM